jgi:flagellar protein FlaJ
MDQKVPLMIVPSDISKKLAVKLRGIGSRLEKLFPGLEDDLRMTDLDSDSEEYMAMSFVNALFFAMLITGMILVIFLAKKRALDISLVASTAIGIGVFIAFIILYSKYPGILASKKADMIEKDLVFALKDLSLQITAGVSLYDSFMNISHSCYGDTSNEFKRVVQDINRGIPMPEAIELMALRTKSEYLKRTSWQIDNTLKSGSNIRKTLKRIIADLSAEQRNRIRNYARELNLWSLIYMLFAVAIPSIGSTMLVILSSFAGFGITKNMFIMFVVMCIIVQYVLIGFVKARRPISNI